LRAVYFLAFKENHEPHTIFMYRFKSADIPPELDISSIMATQQGTEGRFAGRFVKFAGTSETFTKAADLTGQAIADLRTSAGVISEQKKGVDRLFLLSERAIQAVSLLEKESGVHQVDNIPLPNDNVRGNYGKKMGYAALALGFLSEGIVHFMEEVITLQSALESRDKIISQMAAHIPSVETIGAYEDVSLSDLTSVKPADISTYTRAEKPVSPVVNSATSKSKKK